MRVLVIDSHNMLHRARFGFGEGDHKLYFNFFRMLLGEIKRHTPSIVYVVDEGNPEQSLALMEGYKGNRVRLDDSQFHREKAEVFETVKNITGFVYIQHPNFEADDVIAHVSTVLHPNDDVVIVSSDSDFIQLISDKVQLWNPRKKSFIPEWKHADYVTWKALRGDATDCVPGVPGVGAKTADKLCASDEVRDAFLAAKPGRREAFDVSYAVIKLKNVPIKGLRVEQSDFLVDRLFEEFSQREFKSMTGKAWPGWIQSFTNAGGKYVSC